MALPDHFRRVAVALFESDQLKSLPKQKRAVSAIEIARHNGVELGTLTVDSAMGDINKIKETSQGKKKSRLKRGTAGHSRKMQTFDEILQLYLEETAKERGE